MRTTLKYLAFWGALLLSPAAALDNGQWGNVDPAIRNWFKSVRSPSGVPCCDIADGHPTSYEIRGSDFYVPIEGIMVRIPPEAVVQHSRNPTGDAVVWYIQRWTTDGKSDPWIRCFVLPEMT